MHQSSYTARGVSPTKEEVHAAIAPYGLGLYPGAFCKIVEDSLGTDDYCTVMHADGAGTKSTIAYIHYRETGDASVFRGIAQDSLVMNLDDMLCVGVTSDFVVSNTIGRNAHRIDGAILREIVRGYAEFADVMAGQGIKMLMAGGETADVGDLVPTIIVDSTVFARMRRADVVDCRTIRPGNVIVGLASFGKASYETAANSGIASNGFTAARHMLMASRYAERYPETYSTTLAPENVYSGKYDLKDPLPGSDMTVGEALLSPTRTYLPIMKDVFAEHRGAITGVVQASGGGQVKCNGFGNGLHFVKNRLFPPPPIFQALAATAALEQREMYQVFNMGHRLEIFCDATSADAIIDVAASYNVAAQVIGHVESNIDQGTNRLTIDNGEEQYVFF